MNQESELLKRAILSQSTKVDPSLRFFDINMRIAGRIAQAGVSFEDQGERRIEVLDREASKLLKEHRTATYRPGLGTWFSIQITVDRRGPVDVAFNFDKEPAWGHPIRDSHYAEDFLRFPRDAAHTPPWLVGKLKKFEKELLEKGVQLPL